MAPGVEMAGICSSLVALSFAARRVQKRGEPILRVRPVCMCVCVWGGLIPKMGAYKHAIRPGISDMPVWGR